MCYLRLDSETTDYVFEECEMDQILRQAVRKFSSSFIQKKIRLEYEPMDWKAVTDEKWLLFIIEQVLSNSLKYTRPQGKVSIEREKEQILCIRDNGIGIAPEDIPRIFEKGYTGYNGRRTVSALPRRIFPGSLKRAIPAITAEVTKRPAALACIFAGGSVTIWDTGSGSLLLWERGLQFI